MATPDGKSPPKGPRSFIAAQERMDNLTNPSGPLSIPLPFKPPAPPSSSSLEVPSPKLARSASTPGEPYPPIAERMRALRESATSEPSSTVPSPPTASIAVDEVPPSPAVKKEDDSSAAGLSSPSNGRNPKFPPPLASILSQVKNPASPSPGPAESAWANDHPPSSSLPPPSNDPASTAPNPIESAQQPSSSSAHHSSRTASPSRAGGRDDKDDRSRRPTDDRAGGAGGVARDRDPQDYDRDRIVSGGGPPSSSTGRDRDRRRDDHERPPPSSDADRSSRGRDPRDDPLRGGGGSRTGRSPDWKRREEEERRRYVESRGRDPRDDRERDSRDGRDSRDPRERERRREESPRRGAYDRDSHRERRRSPSPPPPPPFVPKSPEVFVHPSRQALVHPSRRPAVDAASSAVQHRISPPPQQVPAVYNRGERYSPRLDARPLDRDPSAPSSYPPRSYGDAPVNQNYQQQPPYPGSSAPFDGSASQKRPREPTSEFPSSFPPFPPTLAGPPEQQQPPYPGSSAPFDGSASQKRPREPTSEFPSSFPPFPPTLAGPPEAENGQRRSLINRDHRYGVASDTGAGGVGAGTGVPGLGLNVERGGDPRLASDVDGADAKRRKLLDRAQEEKAAHLASMQLSSSYLLPSSDLPEDDLLSSVNLPPPQDDVRRPSSNGNGQVVAPPPPPPSVGAGGGSLLARILPLEVDEALGDSRRPTSYSFKRPSDRPSNWRSRPCTFFVDGKRCPNADDCSFRHALPDDNGCRFFQAYTQGRHDAPCHNGDRCERSHSMNAPCVFYLSAEGCGSKKNCRFRHAYYVHPPTDETRQIQANDVRRGAAGGGGRDRGRDGRDPDPRSTSRLESYRRGPAPEEELPDRRFAPLIEALADGRTELCSKAAAQVLSIDKHTYKKAGVASWSQFLGLAQQENVVELGRGDVPGREWVKLTPTRGFKRRERSPSRTRSIGGGGPSTKTRRDSHSSTKMEVDESGFTFDDLISELGLPPPAEDLTTTARRPEPPSSSTNGYDSSPTKKISSLPPPPPPLPLASSSTVPPPPPPAAATSAPVLSTLEAENASLRRQLASLKETLQFSQEDLELATWKAKREETRAEEAEQRAKVMEERWKAARALNG